MTHPMIKSTTAALLFMALCACSTVEDVIAYGKGPFDHGPIPRSETALEGLHESSWGNSGKWGAKEAPEGEGGKEDISLKKPPEEASPGF